MSYVLSGLMPGDISVAPETPGFTYLPPNQSFTLGPDRIGVDFKAYHRNALSLESFTNGILHFVYAGSPGERIVIERSSDFSNWNSYLTNTVPAEGLFSITENLGTSTEGRGFFRSSKP